MPQKIKLVVVGKIKNPEISSLIAEFRKRLTTLCALEIIELKDEGLKKEAAKLQAYLSSSTYLLDETGKQLTSQEFAAFLKSQEKELTLIIGGPEGIAPELKQKSKQISLSRMTLTHELARLFLVEQIYRAMMINSNRSYYQK